MVTAIVVVGGLAEAAAWWVVARRRASVWLGLGPVLAIAGLAAVATGKIVLCPAVSGTVAARRFRSIRVGALSLVGLVGVHVTYAVAVVRGALRRSRG